MPNVHTMRVSSCKPANSLVQCKDDVDIQALARPNLYTAKRLQGSGYPDRAKHFGCLKERSLGTGGALPFLEQRLPLVYSDSGDPRGLCSKVKHFLSRSLARILYFAKPFNPIKHLRPTGMPLAKESAQR